MKQLLFIALAITGWNLSGYFTNPRDNHQYNRKTNYLMQDTVKIELELASFTDMAVLFIKDTANTTEGIKDVLGKSYGELMQYIQANKLQPRKFMAWYYSTQSPWIMDVAVQTDNLPEKSWGRVQSRIVKGSEVIIAHMQGPYSQVGLAYTKINTWLKDNKRKVKGNPFEVYLNDPSSVKSPFEIKTDVYQPIE